MAIQSFDVQCEHCHAQEQFKIGFADKDDTIEKAIDNFHGKTQIQIRSIIKKHTINNSRYGYALFTCHECHTLFNPYTVEIEYDDIMLFKPFHKCEPCNATLVRVDRTIDSYSCKHCNKVSTL